MNQTQRKFLIDKIEEKNKGIIRSLENSIPERPNLESFILHEIMSSRIEIVSNEKIKELLTERVLGLKDRDRLFGDRRSDWDFKRTICFKAEDFFVVPERYNQLIKNWEKETKEIREQLSEITRQEEMLVLRIQLASPKKLETLISEVDDFGDLSLFDTKLKQLE